MQEVIRMLSLPETMVERLNPCVQETYRELWQELEDARKQRESEGLRELQG